MPHLVIYLLCAFSAITCIACATSSAQQKADKTLNSFVESCSEQDDEDARKYLLNADNRIAVCPTELPQHAVKTDILAIRSNSQFIKTQHGWKLNPGDSFSTDSPQLRLKQLKYALLHQDLQKLNKLIVSKTAPNNLDEWIQSSQANEIYAAIALQSNPWFVVEGKTAVCNVSGIQLQFEWNDGEWKWLMP